MRYVCVCCIFMDHNKYLVDCAGLLLFVSLFFFSSFKDEKNVCELSCQGVD